MKTMKKTLAVLFAAVLLLATVIPAAAQNGDLAVTSVANARTGEIVEVMVSLENNPGLQAALIRLNYDSTGMALVDVEDQGLFGAGNMMPGGDVTEQDYGALWVEYDHAVTATGNLLKIRFKINDDAALGTYGFTVTCDPENTRLANGDSYDLSVASGSITVVRLPGDANRDGKVNLKDVILIMRYVVGGWNVQIDLASANVDGDNDVDVYDAILIKQFIVGGYNVTLI